MEYEDLCDLMDRADARGVAIEVDLHEEWLWLGHVERTSGPPGSGAIVLEELLEMADDADLPVRAAVEADSPRLIEWYVDLGFEILAMPNEHEGDRIHAILVRRPERVPIRARSTRLQEA